ncbi:MAG TPA: FAD-binding oxidoreductase [Chloroflexia bacterium]|nr:FAD-binding oxidoreductase [Chloroflexia bacterium]
MLDLNQTQMDEKAFAPANEEEAAELLREISRQNQTVRFVGGGTKQDRGNPRRETAVTLSTLKLNELIDYQPEDLTITVQTGMPFERLQAILGEQGQFLPLDPPNLPGQTTGGVLSTNVSGPRRLLYGTARDLLIGCRFVLADGSIGHSGGKVVKNVAGYDLHKLFIGAYGTLGLLTEVTFKVTPRPSMTGAGLARFEEAEKAFAAARRCARSNLMPSALEVVTALPREPEVYNLYFGAEGMAVAVEAQLEGLSNICREAGASSVELVPDGAALWQRLANTSTGNQYNLILKGSTVLTGLPGATALFEKTLATSGASGGIQARAGNGLIYLYAAMAEGQSEKAAELIKEARPYFQRDGGSLVIENAPLSLRQYVDAWGDFGDTLPSQQAVKASLDPQKLLNPGVLEF